MNSPVRPAAMLPGDTPSRWRAWRTWLLRTFPGRALVLGLAIKLVTWPLGAVVVLPAAVEAIDMVGSLALLFVCAYGLTRLAVWAKRRLLWRVRRKLILSYVFVGVVPGLLVITFFLLAGLILLFNVSSYLVQSRVRSLTDQARFLAQTAQLEVQRSATAANLAEALERRQSSTATRYPFLSIAIVPVSGLTCPVGAAGAVRLPRTLPAALPIAAGSWAHLDVPQSLPKWIPCDGFAGIVAFEVPPDLAAGTEGGTRLVMRAVALPEVADPTWGIVLDMPLSTVIEQRILEETGIRLGEVTAELDRGRRPPLGRAFERRPAEAADLPVFSPTTQQWVAFLDFSDWNTGAIESASVAIRINLWEIYNRISAVSQAAVGGMSFGQLLLIVLAVIGTLFLIIQFVALVIGFVLARQITGAVHDLFTGTQHVRAGDFGHQIPVRARDQLGELAESFNLMTGEVTTLLGEMAEKGRMEQEMFAAREIQQKLLPAGPLKVTGLSMSAFCEPAREVAGDYYDFLPITDTMTGVLIADVAGKGLAAGLYMAQLKVIVQSLARLHHEPKEFLSAVNKVVSANLDGKSFITMTYGVIDVERREMTFARAGHCPLIHVPGDQPPGRRKARMLVPDGLVVGLQIDDGTLFDGLLQEQTVSLAPGDLVVWFTDGISETMNETFDCFGEERLAQVVEQYAHLPFDQLRSYILAELRAFAGGADQHDDMTMILMKVDVPPPVPVGSGEAGVIDHGLTVIFRTQSDIEANVIEALLDSHGVETLRTAGPTPGLFPMSLNPLGVTQISVRAADAGEAVRIIDSHRDQVSGGGMVVTLPQAFDALEARLGYRFRDRGLLEHALTHKSKAHEDPSGGVTDNESLEFLGDAVLGLVVSDALFRAFPSYSEGQKSKIKANLVSTASLAEMAELMGLGEHMILGRGEEKTGGRHKQALLADTCEALIAAIYLDGGLEPARLFLMRELATEIEAARQPEYFGRDHKSRLQERLQSLGRPLPWYRIASELGPDHRKLFYVEVVVGEQTLAQGTGRTKKEAEQEGARLALAEITRTD